MSEGRDEVEELVTRARSGEVDAFEGLYRRYQAGIHTFLRSQVRDVELAADLTQDTFVRAWESLPRLRKVGAFRGWLYRIAANLVRDEVKSGRARLEVTESALAATESRAVPEAAARTADGPEDAVVSEEMREEVWRALETLPPEQRAVVVMHHMEGMGTAEIAEAMRVRPGTVMSRLARAREALRNRLRRYVEGSDDGL